MDGIIDTVEDTCTSGRGHHVPNLRIHPSHMLAHMQPYRLSRTTLFLGRDAVPTMTPKADGFVTLCTAPVNAVKEMINR